MDLLRKSGDPQSGVNGSWIRGCRPKHTGVSLRPTASARAENQCIPKPGSTRVQRCDSRHSLVSDHGRKEIATARSPDTTTVKVHSAIGRGRVSDLRHFPTIQKIPPRRRINNALEQPIKKYQVNPKQLSLAPQRARPNTVHARNATFTYAAIEMAQTVNRISTHSLSSTKRLRRPLPQHYSTTPPASPHSHTPASPSPTRSRAVPPGGVLAA